MVQIKGETDDTLPCKLDFTVSDIDVVIELLHRLPEFSPDLLHEAGLDPDAWQPLLGAAMERMRGSSAATTKDKKKFIEAVLDFCKKGEHIREWSFIGQHGRQDYKVVLPDGKHIAIEAKGCPDGNNTTIWDRPSWADEFIVWSLCPNGSKNPGKGVWSGVTVRLIPKVAADKTVVDAFVFWDGRCGTDQRRCPKPYGVRGELRSKATDLPGQSRKEDWLPPPCIYLLPRRAPGVNNKKPITHTPDTCSFAKMLLTAFNVPLDQQSNYVHEADVEARGSQKGTQILIKTISRGWPNGVERVRSTGWKDVKREA